MGLVRGCSSLALYDKYSTSATYPLDQHRDWEVMEVNACKRIPLEGGELDELQGDVAIGNWASGQEMDKDHIELAPIVFPPPSVV